MYGGDQSSGRRLFSDSCLVLLAKHQRLAGKNVGSSPFNEEDLHHSLYFCLRYVKSSVSIEMYGFSPRNARLSNFVEDYLNVRIQQVQYVLENSC